MTFKEFGLKGFRKLYRLINNSFVDDMRQGFQYMGYCELLNQDANDYVRELLHKGAPCMVSKFGTIEFEALTNYLMSQERSHSFGEYIDFIKGNIGNLGWLNDKTLNPLCSNAGFFPNDVSLLPQFYAINYEAMKQIDVLGSYIYAEKYFTRELSSAKKVNLDGYYAPYYYKNPWTMELLGKKVLVVHPFAEDIASQYKNHRKEIWQDPNVLPEFELITYKSVQSMLGIKTPYKTWFDALEKMENDISKIDFDIALIGCGAYGMPLAAYVKKMGKQAVHLAGWTQVLFGIIGTRWQNNHRISKMMNEYWIHPSPENVPKDAKKVENACYW
jgi:hypothetical protein